MTFDTDIPELFERKIRCEKCFQPVDLNGTEYDAERHALFICKTCGHKSEFVMDLTVSGKPDRRTFCRPFTEEEYAKIPATDPETIFTCFKNVSWPLEEEYMMPTQSGPVFKPDLLARWLANNQPFKIDIETGRLYFFNGKRWIADAEAYLEKAVSLCLKIDYKKSMYENVAFDLRAHIYEKIEFSKNLALENGVLNPETGEFWKYGDPNCKDDMTFYSIATAYNPEADCPKFKAFIAQVVTPDDALLLQEWSGYFLLPSYSLHKMLWTIGSGRNGKGVWMRTMNGIIGKECVGNTELQEFDGEHDFSLSALYGKLANFCSEPLTKGELETNLLKKATGKDEIDARLMYTQKRLRFTNCAKMTILANKFPKCTDQSDGWLERILFIKFPNSFVGENQVLDIENNWLNDQAERSGILNWMLEGLHRLLARGYFVTGAVQEEAITEYLRNSDTMSAFIKECAEWNNDKYITRPETVFAYNTYCDHYGLTAESGNKLSARLKETPHVKDTAIRIEGKLERVWKGVTFKLIKESEVKPVGEASKSVTDVTLVTDFTTRTKNQQKNKEVQNPVTTVTSVTNPSVEPQELEENTLYYSTLKGFTTETKKCPLCDSGTQAEFAMTSKDRPIFFTCPTHKQAIVNDAINQGEHIVPSIPNLRERLQ